MRRRCHRCRSRAAGLFLLAWRRRGADDARAADRQHLLPLCELHRSLLAAAGDAGRAYPQRGERWGLVRQAR